MPKATWNGVVIAEAPDDVVEVVEGNVYFPKHAMVGDYLRTSNTVTTCHWKGSANYYDIVVAGKINRDAAWTYLEPLDAARAIAGHVAFWRGVTVER